MANEEHPARLKQGVKAWNQWRAANNIQPNLSGADLRGATLSGAALYNVILYDAILTKADLSGATLTRAILTKADLSGATLTGANLTGADLTGANLTGADLTGANFFKANFGGAILERAILVQTNLKAAYLTGCAVYGISAWDVQLNDHTEQKSLLISKSGDPRITVDHLELDFGHLGIHPLQTRQEGAGAIRKLGGVCWEGRHHEMTQPPMPLQLSPHLAAIFLYLVAGRMAKVEWKSPSLFTCSLIIKKSVRLSTPWLRKPCSF